MTHSSHSERYATPAVGCAHLVPVNRITCAMVGCSIDAPLWRLPPAPALRSAARSPGQGVRAGRHAPARSRARAWEKAARDRAPPGSLSTCPRARGSRVPRSKECPQQSTPYIQQQPPTRVPPTSGRGPPCQGPPGYSRSAPAPGSLPPKKTGAAGLTCFKLPKFAPGLLHARARRARIMRTRAYEAHPPVCSVDPLAPGLPGGTRGRSRSSVAAKSHSTPGDTLRSLSAPSPLVSCQAAGRRLADR
jgi:hypothetical protein